MNKKILLLITLCTQLFCTYVLYAQSVQLPLNVVSRGGGNSTGGNLRLQTSIGQNAVASATASGFNLSAGYFPAVGSYTISNGTLVSSEGFLYNFGNILVGTTVSHAITLTNIGNLRVTEIVIQPFSSPFTIEVSCTVSELGPGESCELIVSFTPFLEDVFEQSITISFHDGVVPTTTSLALSGTGLLENFAIGGMKFNDENGDGIRDINEEGLANWGIQIYKVSSDGIYNLLDSTRTDSAGNYYFVVNGRGNYSVFEENQREWIQTYPPAPGYYDIEILDSTTVYSNLDFGNFESCVYIGPENGDFSNPDNWSCGHVPDNSDGVIIEDPVVFNDVPYDTLQALSITDDGSITFGAGFDDTLTIEGPVIIDGDLIFSDSANGELICYDDWINNGTFNPGNSNITFSGPNQKIISGDGSGNEALGSKITSSGIQAFSQTTFFNLTINGDSTYLQTNISIQNTLTLNDSLFPRTQDTITIQNDDKAGISGEGIVTHGSILRKIRQGETEPYRFESSNSTLKFEGTDYPDSVLITTLPQDSSRTQELLWQVIPSIDDKVNRRVIATGVGHFSKWVFGKPGTGFRKISLTDSLTHAEQVRRTYSIEQFGGENFTAELSLRYDSTEIIDGDFSDSLYLLRGPYIRETLNENWNMLSVPLQVDDFSKVTIFPTSASPAFAYVGGYSVQETLSLNTGYWLKFDSSVGITLLGDDVQETRIPVATGWNMVGAISFPVATNSIVSEPENAVVSQFYGFSINSGYTIEDSLEPFGAYWVKSNSDAELLVDANTGIAKVAQSISIRNFLQQQQEITFHDNSGASQKIYISSENLAAIENFELPPPPPAGLFHIRFATNRIVESLGEMEKKEIPLKSYSVDYPLEVEISSPKEEKVKLSLLVDGNNVRLINGKAIIKHEPASITLKIERLSGIKSVPKEFALRQNYPNPFNPSTIIGFELPVASDVTLKIYNILGQEVSTLLDHQSFNEGVHEIPFNAGGLASGVYYYRFTTADAGYQSELNKKNYSAIRKMLFIR